jgi:hypothetical protein
VDWTPHLARVVERLGEDAQYTPPGGGGASTVRGVYQEPYRVALDVMDGSAPTFSLVASDVPTLGRGALFVIRGVTFKVVGVEPDPVSGLVMAKLEKQE